MVENKTEMIILSLSQYVSNVHPGKSNGSLHCFVFLSQQRRQHHLTHDIQYIQDVAQLKK